MNGLLHFFMAVCKNFGGIVKSKILLFFVIPAKAGIQFFQLFLDSRFHGSDDFEIFYGSSILVNL